MKLRNFLMFGSMAVLGAAFTSCSKGEDLFDHEAYVAKEKNEYATYFAEKYGPVDPSQTWDFATMYPVYSLPSNGSAATTRGGSASLSEEGKGKMIVENEVIRWMSTNMKAGKNNSALGSPFYMITNDTEFTIVPFYQGYATYYWELWMKVGETDQKIWDKYDIKYRMSAGGDLITPDQYGIPKDAYEVEAKTFSYKATKGAQMYFYLKVWTKETDHSTTTCSYKQTSLEQKMLAIENAPRPKNVPAGNSVTVIGCEDKQSGDNDFEDLAFIMYGKPVPPIKRVDEVEVRETKRYMMEDLGTKNDFDFNDVVVDLSIVYNKKITYKIIDAYGNVEIEKEEVIPSTRHQEAIVRAAGGTIDFTLEIGTSTITRWKKSQKFTVADMLNTGWGGTPLYYSGENSVLATIPILDDDWNPNTNNIRVIVEDNGASDGVKTIKFPKQGETPMMIAVDEDKNWMRERNSIPSSWWY